MRSHVELGEQIVAAHGNVGALGMFSVSQHHEKLNGGGYPRRLGARDIHLFGRITAVADCFDAMTTNRSYQRALTAYDALLRMRGEMRDQYDQDLLEQFIRVLRAPDDLLQHADLAKFASAAAGLKTA